MRDDSTGARPISSADAYCTYIHDSVTRLRETDHGFADSCFHPSTGRLHSFRYCKQGSADHLSERSCFRRAWRGWLVSALLLVLAPPANADLQPVVAEGDIRLSPPSLPVADPFAAAPDSGAWPVRWTKNRLLKNGDQIHLGPGARLEWRSGNGERHILRGPASALITGESLALESGRYWRGSRPEPGLELRWLPSPPARGRITRLQAALRGAEGQVSLQTLPERSTSVLHFDGIRGGQRLHSAMIALARTDWRRELRLEVRIATPQGTLTEILAFPVSAATETPLDTRGIFGRRAGIALLWHWRAAPSFFPYQGQVLRPEQCVAWKETQETGKQFPAWTQGGTSQGIWLPPDKQALLADQAGIQRENAIHWQATSWDTPEILWTGPFIIPAWHRYSSPFSESRTFVGLGTGVHLGIDIASFYGTAVAAPNSGIVRFAGKTTLCGNNIIIDHGRRVFTKIMHLDSLFVTSGQRVERGQPVGMTGTSGLSTGPHIHWEMLVGGVRVDPEEWVALRQGGLQ